METALLFCAIRAAEILGTVAFSRDTRAGFEISAVHESERGRAIALLPNLSSAYSRYHSQPGPLWVRGELLGPESLSQGQEQNSG